MKSKKELYTFLLQDGHAYLPSIESTNIYFLKQVIKGEKNVSIPIPYNDPVLVSQQEGCQALCCPLDRRSQLI